VQNGNETEVKSRQLVLLWRTESKAGVQVPQLLARDPRAEG
jgi:hypothetical protein